MKLIKTIFLTITAFGIISMPMTAYARAPHKPFVNHYYNDLGDISRFDNNLTEKDWEELYDFINSKRCINLNQKGNNLSIAGDVRVDWRHTNEKSNGGGFTSDDLVKVYDSATHIRGGSSVDEENIRIPRNDFDIEFNLYFDYVCGRAWAVAQLEFDNTAGIDYNDHKGGDFDSNGHHIAASGGDPKGLHGSGFCTDLCLKKAYFGYNFCCDGNTRFDVEIGRRHLYHVFDSEVQFLSRFDGVLLRYTSSFDCLGDWYVNAAGFVVDERANHFAWVAEFGLLNAYDTGLDLKYSFIDWTKHGKNRYSEKDPVGSKFQVSQATAYYHFDPDFLCMPAKLYGAFLYNHGAKSFRSNGYDGDATKTIRTVTVSETTTSSAGAHSHDFSVGASPASQATTVIEIQDVAVFPIEGNGGPELELVSILPSGDHAHNVGFEFEVNIDRDADDAEVRRYHVSDDDNKAWYLGFRLGEVCNCGDWALDVQYQYVQAQSIPDQDVSGIGRGNWFDERLTKTGRGNTNYKGWRVEALYGLTDNLIINSTLEASREIKKSVGGTHRYSQFQLETIYAF